MRLFYNSFVTNELLSSVCRILSTGVGIPHRELEVIAICNDVWVEGGPQEHSTEPWDQEQGIAIRTEVSWSVCCRQSCCVFSIDILITPLVMGCAGALGEGWLTEIVRKWHSMREIQDWPVVTDLAATGCFTPSLSELLLKFSWQIFWSPPREQSPFVER